MKKVKMTLDCVTKQSTAALYKGDIALGRTPRSAGCGVARDDVLDCFVMYQGSTIVSIDPALEDYHARACAFYALTGSGVGFPGQEFERCKPIYNNERKDFINSLNEKGEA